MVMMLINLKRIVRIFTIIFICFMNQSAAKLIIVIQTVPVSGGYALLQSKPGSQVQFLGTSYEVDGAGYLGLGFGR